MANWERGIRVRLISSPHHASAARVSVALLAAACAPAWAVGSGRSPQPPLPAANGPANAAPSLTLPPLVWGDWRGAALMPCRLEMPAAPESGAADPGAALTSSFPALRLPAPPQALLHCSLGGPFPALTSPDALPRLQDVTRQADQDDTLRVLRAHW